MAPSSVKNGDDYYQHNGVKQHETQQLDSPHHRQQQLQSFVEPLDNTTTFNVDVHTNAAKIEMFHSCRERRHRRTDSRNRSLWHRASRRLIAAATNRSSSIPGSTTSSQPTPEPGTAPSHKHSSLTMKTSTLEHQTLLQQEQEQDQQHNAKLRHQTWYFSSNHVLVNRERLAHGLSPLMRSTILDDKARQVARWAAEGKDLNDFITNEDAPTFVSGNVLAGCSIRQIHGQTLERETCRRERNNLLNPEYHEFGMGTFKEPKTGLLYLCQLFATG